MKFLDKIFKKSQAESSGAEVGPDIPKYRAPLNPSYCATVVRIPKDRVKYESLDNLVGVTLYGNVALVSKNTKEGELGIVFGPETQLSDVYVSANSLYRHKELNADHEKAGFLEDNRRVKAVKFRKVPSQCLYMPLSSLEFLGADLSDLMVGMSFDAVNGIEIARKYQLPVKPGRTFQGIPGVKSRVDRMHIPMHYDSDQYYMCDRNIGDDTFVICSAKLHGTSIIVGHTYADHRPSFRDKVAKFFGVPVIERVFVDGLPSSRKVIKDVNDPAYAGKKHYYAVDVWSEYGAKLAGKLPKNYLLYGELVGWDSTGSPLQDDYTYDLPKGECRLYAYRIAIINEDGVLYDLPNDDARKFCEARSIQWVPELWRGRHGDFKVDQYMNVKLKEKFPQCPELSNKDTVDEGVVLRIERPGLAPWFVKSKASQFYEFESKKIDDGVVDIESQESNNENAHEENSIK